jgi:hypothetical protein
MGAQTTAGGSIIWGYDNTSRPPRGTVNAAILTGGNPFGPVRPLATEFELQVRQLRLTRRRYTCSVELRRWCERNRNRYYTPEWLLEEWGITVDPSFSDAA